MSPSRSEGLQSGSIQFTLRANGRESRVAGSDSCDSRDRSLSMRYVREPKIYKARTEVSPASSQRVACSVLHKESPRQYRLGTGSYIFTPKLYSFFLPVFLALP